MWPRHSMAGLGQEPCAEPGLDPSACPHLPPAPPPHVLAKREVGAVWEIPHWNAEGRRVSTACRDLLPSPLRLEGCRWRQGPGLLSGSQFPHLFHGDERGPSHLGCVTQVPGT